MSLSQHHTRDLQRKVVRSLLIIAALILVVAVPLVIDDEFRLRTAHTLGLAPGKNAERLAEGDEGATLVVLPLGEYDGAGRERYRYAASFITWPNGDGTRVEHIETGSETTIPIKEIEFVGADAEGEHVLMRGPDAGGVQQSLLITSADLSWEMLPEGQKTPEIEGDWETPVWAKTTGICDRYSPQNRFVACFNRADAASYLAGDWQVDVQLFGDFRVVEPVYRGMGFLPIIGFAHDDTWLYFQNETGIWRIEIPQDMQVRARQ